MTATKRTRAFAFAEIEHAFELSSYWLNGKWCPAVQKYPRGTYSIRVLRSETVSGPNVAVTYDYFEIAADGTIDIAPRGYAKDYKPGRIIDIDAAAQRYATPERAS